MSLLKKALSLREAGDLAGAATALEAYLQAKPAHALAHYLLACTYDGQGKESLAVPHYEAGLSGDLTTIERRSSFVGLGSSYRALGEYQKAHEVLRDALVEFPEATEIEVFMSMAEYNLGHSQQAIQRLLCLLVQNTANEHVLRYKKAIEFYAKDLSATWSDA